MLAVISYSGTETQFTAVATCQPSPLTMKLKCEGDSGNLFNKKFDFGESNILLL